MARIGLYGGTFDPIHHGHLISARSLAEQFSLERVFLIPAGRPPHKPNIVLSAVEDRLEMARRAVAGDSLFEVSDIEARREGPSFTIETVERARESFGKDADLFWFIGGDSLPELPAWHRVRELVQQVVIVTATRPGWRRPTVTRLAAAVGDDAARLLLSNCVATPSIGISATEIRRRLTDGKSVRYLTPLAVVEFIEERGLYH